MSGISSLKHGPPQSWVHLGSHYTQPPRLPTTELVMFPVPLYPVASIPAPPCLPEGTRTVCQVADIYF